MIVVFVVDTSASMNQSTRTGMTLLDYAKSAVERFVKRIRDPNRRYQHHFMLVSCAQDNSRASSEGTLFNQKTLLQDRGNLSSTPSKGRVRVGWDQSTNKDVFQTELKNLRGTDVSDIGGALQEAFELMNQIRLQFNWDTYALGRAPWSTNVAVCVLLTDATTTYFTDSGLMSDTLTIPQSKAVGSELTHEPYRWDQRLFTIALKLPAISSQAYTQYPPANINEPRDLAALSEATGGSLYVSTSKSVVEQSVDQIVQKIKPGACVRWAYDISTTDCEAKFERSILTPYFFSSQNSSTATHEFYWPIAESFWLDRSSTTLPPRNAQPILTYRHTVETAIESATNSMLLDTIKFPADTYLLEQTSVSPVPGRGQRWLVYVQGSKGENRLGDPIGFLRPVPPNASAKIQQNTTLLVLLPYNFPVLFSLLVEAVRVYQASGQSLNVPSSTTSMSSSTTTYMFQAKAMPSSWRESFSSYVQGCPIYYYAPLKKALRKYNLHEMIPDVHDFGRSYQISNYLNRARELAITESENQNKAHSRNSRVDQLGNISNAISTATKKSEYTGSFLHSSNGTRSVEASPSSSPMPYSAAYSDKPGLMTNIMDSVATMSLTELISTSRKSRSDMFSAQIELPFPKLIQHHKPLVPKNRSMKMNIASPLRLRPSIQAEMEDSKHHQPIDVMSDYESRLIKKEALRNPLAEAEPDEDTPMGLRRRQLCFNLGNPYRKNSTKQSNASPGYQGEAADEAATLGEQSPKVQRMKKRFPQWERDRKQNKRQATSRNRNNSITPVSGNSCTTNPMNRKSPPSPSQPQSPTKIDSPTASPSRSSDSGSPIAGSTNAVLLDGLSSPSRLSVSDSSGYGTSPADVSPSVTSLSFPNISSKDTIQSQSITNQAEEQISSQTKEETAKLLGLYLKNNNSNTPNLSPSNFTQHIYSILAENYEAWKTIMQLLKARRVTLAEENFILNALQSMKGGNTVARTYIQRSISIASDFRKMDMKKKLEGLLQSLNFNV